jgi:hypothetical protein
MGSRQREQSLNASGLPAVLIRTRYNRRKPCTAEEAIKAGLLLAEVWIDQRLDRPSKTPGLRVGACAL